MEEVILPCSGWRFVAVERQPGREAMLDKDPQHKLWRVPGTMPAGAETVCGFHGGDAKTNLLRRSRYMFLWGYVDGEIHVTAVAPLGRGTQLPVYRVGPYFWVAEAVGHIRHFRISTADSPGKEYAPALLGMMTARNRCQRRRMRRKAGIDIKPWEP